VKEGPSTLPPDGTEQTPRVGRGTKHALEDRSGANAIGASPFNKVGGVKIAPEKVRADEVMIHR